MEVLNTAPEASTFIALAEHQSRTPSSFHSGPPVLHYHSPQCKVVILERDLLATPALKGLRGGQSPTNGAEATQPAEDDEGTEIAIEDVEIWATSDKFLLYSPAASSGVSIPYPSISLHAIQRLRVPGSESEAQGLYMQIAMPSAPAEDDEEQCMTFTVVPPTEPGVGGDSTASEAAATSTAAERAAQDLSDEPEETPTQLLYNAVSACSNLHPDPVEPGDDDEDEGGKFMFSDEYGRVLDSTDGGLPPPVDGSSGWITADNMHEFFDEEGNWIAEGQPPSFPLGPGAGTVRQREGENGDGTGVDGESEETKWRRTD